MSKKILIPKSVANLTDDELGRQLVDQYGRACAGMVEYIAFGALAENAKIKQEAAILTPRAESKSDGSGRYRSGTGFKAWLSEFTGGSITEPTAYRYMELADIVRSEVGAGATVDLYHVLRGEQLEAKEAKLRDKVVNFVSGKTQRQLLLGAGKWEEDRRAPAVTKESEQSRHARLADAARRHAIEAFSALHSVGDRWQLLKDEEVELAIEDARKFAKRAEAWLKTPHEERARVRIEELLGWEAPQ